MSRAAWGGWLFLLAAVASPAAAPSWVRTQEFVLPTDQALVGPANIFANRIRLDGSAGDDVFLFAGDIEFNGQGRNDVWAFGHTIALAGHVADHARLGGQTIHVAGRLDNGLWALGNSVRVAPEAEVRGGAAIWAEDAIVAGHVEGPLRVSARRVTLGGTVLGNVRLTADDIVALPGTRIEGDLVYSSSSEFLPGQRVAITGQFARVPRPEAPPWQGALVFVFLYGGALIVGIPFVLLFPGFAGAATRAVRRSFWPSLAAGALALALIPMLVLFALVTYVGIPLALVLSTATGVLLYLSQYTAALTLGSWLLRRRGPMGIAEALTTLSVGLVVFYALALIPVAGIFILMGVLFVAFGATLRTLLSVRREPGAGPPAAGRAEPPPLSQETPATGETFS